MKINPIPEILSSFRESYNSKTQLQRFSSKNLPLRSELFNADQMGHYGLVLAKRHILIEGKASGALLKNLAENEDLLLDAHRLLTEAVKAGQRITPAGEWLLDNFYLIQDQIRTGKRHLPKSYNQDLPLIKSEESGNTPRVYDIAIEIVSHSDGRVDQKILNGFLKSYQTEHTLKLGELWAIPIMIRLALIENIRRITEQIARDRIYQNMANYWAEQMIKVAEIDPKGLILVIADMARSNPPLVSPFVAELTRRLQGKGSALALPLNWIEQVLLELGQSGAELIHLEIQKQAADQVSMSNSIGSLRFLGTLNWQDFVESMSKVEEILQTDISGIYPKMDFSTRDQYRHVVENLSKISEFSEAQIAKMVVDLSLEAEKIYGSKDRRVHIGFYLIGLGIDLLEIKVKPQYKPSEITRKTIRKHPLLFYIGSISLLSLSIATGFWLRAYGLGSTWGILIWVGVFGLLSTSHFAIDLINWLITLLFTPKILPRMDYSLEIDPNFKTMVIIPAMLSGTREIDKLSETLELHFLANKVPNLFFGLLTDFTDSKEEIRLEDSFLVDYTEAKFLCLYEKYGSKASDIFYWFHRPRKWNPSEGMWMGEERKRGKLTDLNNLLRGEFKGSFLKIMGNEAIFPEIKFVITLDSDTILPRESASKMIASLAHPLNRAYYDEQKQRVTDGYGILQPRIGLSLTGSSRSLFARMHGNDLGIDPYSQTISDVYQDLFDEGSFIGKGIYEVDIYRKGLNHQFPDNRILSHDLLEGCYIRSGLLGDVELYEEYPSSYFSDVKRRYRWIRGDWQIAAWIMPKIPKLGRKNQRNILSGLSKWKIIDNLRRSLVPIALLGLLLLGWTFLHDAWFWTIAISFLLILPSLIKAAKDILSKPSEITLKQHFGDSINSILDDLFQTLFLITCLPFEAFYTFRAILITLWRVLITRKYLLEWNLYSRISKNKDSLVGVYRQMAITSILGIFGLIYLSLASPYDHFVADPILLLWILSPFIAWYLSNPLRQKTSELSTFQTLYLRKIARKTWEFFSTFITEKENWLAPDNFQVHPNPEIAHRTSPTNIGMGLMAGLAANDFGFITNSNFLDFTQKTFQTLEKMERFEGHFYNWYDTLSLLPLRPRYISTVDSGNLTGHLLTLRQGIIEKSGEPLISKKLFLGLKDTFEICRKTVDSNDDVLVYEEILEGILDNKDFELSTIRKSLKSLMNLSDRFVQNFDLLEDQEPYSGVNFESLRIQSLEIMKEMERFFPGFSSDQIPERFNELLKAQGDFSLKDVSTFYEKCLELQSSLQGSIDDRQENSNFDFYFKSIAKASEEASIQLSLVEDLGIRCLLLSKIEFEFLYDETQKLFSIGFNVDEHRRDLGCYDLLASEARLGIFVAISEGKIQQEAWFSLGRQLTNLNGESVLLSWSGSMFEYLMPLLIMPTYANTLLDQTYHTMVQRQIDYGKLLGVPWGISESGYNLVDSSLNYQYQAFGVPELGLKRGLSDDLVIAPYASLMALMVKPKEACENLELLTKMDMEGAFGFYEALDYTPSRLPRGQSNVPIRSFMAHHKGMSLLALNYCLLEQPMQKRFIAEPQLASSLLLLQERIPKSTKFFAPPIDTATIRTSAEEPTMRVIKQVDTLLPEVQLLSNGNYHVMITHTGGGYSRWKNLAITRWKEDTTCDNWGSFCYIRDLEKGDYFSNAYQPSLRESKFYEAVFSQGRAEFKRQDLDLETHTEVLVSPEDDVEIRRIHLTNRSKKIRSLEITTYAEVVLAPAMADALHPAFSNLFVETEIIRDKQAILCTRRPSSPEDKNIWFFHTMNSNSSNIQMISYETDRLQFIGRGQTLENPLALTKDSFLSGTEGPVLDPIVSIQYRFKIDPQETISFDLVYGVGENRESAFGLVDKYQDPTLVERATELSWTHSQVVLRQINASESDAQLYEKLCSSILYAHSVLRADSSILLKNTRGQSGLWGYSISGDLPIVLLRISDQENIDLVKQLVQAHAFWRLKGLMVDLVIWNEEHSGYRQSMQNLILALISDGNNREAIERPGGIFVRVGDQIALEDRILIQTVARIEICDLEGTLFYQVNKKPILKTAVPNLIPILSDLPSPIDFLSPPERNQSNGIGGFSKDGKEYIIETRTNTRCPMPWVNIIASAEFGTMISENGQSYTWALNAHEYRLTPWNNDAVIDSSGEAFYIRDEHSGKYWSPCPLPCRGNSNYLIHHGFGYTLFEHKQDGIYSTMKVFVDLKKSIKMTVLRFKNESGRTRRLSATGYVEWVLGDLRSKTSMQIVTDLDLESDCLIARNLYNKDFNDHRVCFFGTSDSNRTFTGDRTEFIGRNNSLSHPEAMRKTKLSGRTGAALDSCSAFQTPFFLADSQEYEITFFLGTGANIEEVRDLIQDFKKQDAISQSLYAVENYWGKMTKKLLVYSPDESLNLLANGWLLYQTLACRFWARTGFYQSGGAFGFRDQLQDSMALIHQAPELVREHILLCASRQFLEGDVQHWWHPPGGKGVRTRCSDDFLWLVMATNRYIKITGDQAILEEIVNFIDGRPLNAQESSYYDQVSISTVSGTLYEHCKRAIQHGLHLGIHSLPLMGSGDWNDGMDKVGELGKGESVWMAFFLFKILVDFLPLATLKGDQKLIELCEFQSEQLKINIEKNAWDGDWYKRAFFDDGTPLGSKVNEECRIDSISQSWSVISGAGTKEHQTRSTRSAYDHLVRKELSIIQLLDPPFDKSSLNPGYIKGYVPGVRENGGQYTHAAIWLTMAFAELKDRETTYELFSMINPINHSNNSDKIALYKVEPYVVAADIYRDTLHPGRGGWTWYTGSAGWLYRLITESIIGIIKEGDNLSFNPCFPRDWNHFTMIYQFENTAYQIQVLQYPPAQIQINKDEIGNQKLGVPQKLKLDGVDKPDGKVHLVDDEKEHLIELILGNESF